MKTLNLNIEALYQTSGREFVRTLCVREDPSTVDPYSLIPMLKEFKRRNDKESLVDTVGFFFFLIEIHFGQKGV
jgi:hypothetical protein